MTHIRTAAGSERGTKAMKLDTRVENLLWGILIAVTTLGAICAQIYSLSHGIYDIFQFLYPFPLIAVIYAFPHRGVLYTLSISWIYIFLIYVYGTRDPTFLAISTVWFFIYIPDFARTNMRR
jgi:hypothetical protein